MSVFSLWFKFRLLSILNYLFTSPVLHLFVYACCAVSYTHRAHQPHRSLPCLSFIRTLIGTKYHEVSSPSAQTPPSVDLLPTHPFRTWWMRLEGSDVPERRGHVNHSVEKLQLQMLRANSHCITGLAIIPGQRLEQGPYSLRLCI